jgi:asparagine synthase (glutamine-hydrolysing)
VVDLALELPPDVKMPAFRRKDPLRQLMRGRLPDRLIDRPKRGFGVPLASWLRGPLLPLARDYLDPARIRSAGLFDSDAVQGLLDRHVAGGNHANELWVLLQFELWRERWFDAPVRAAAA